MSESFPISTTLGEPKGGSSHNTERELSSSASAQVSHRCVRFGDVVYRREQSLLYGFVLKNPTSATVNVRLACSLEIANVIRFHVDQSNLLNSESEVDGLVQGE